MRSESFLLALVLAGPVAVADEGDRTVSEQLGLELFVTPSAPRAGERVYWLGRLRNLGHPVRVPSELASWLHFDARHRSPHDRVPHVSAVLAGPAPTTPITWTAFEAGDAIELAGEIGESVEDCRAGCPVGELVVSLSLTPTRPPTSHAGEAGAEVVPEALRVTRTLAITPFEGEVLERTSAAAVRVRAVSARARKDAVSVRLAIENATAAPIWIPTRPVVTSCSVSQRSDGGGGMGHSGPGRPARTTASEWTRVAPRRAAQIEVRCEVRPGRNGGTASVAVTSPGARSYGAGFDPPFVWVGGANVEDVPYR